MRRIMAAAVLLVALGASPVTAGAPDATPVVAAYYAGYDPHLAADEIPAERLTDVIYAFGALDAGGRCTLADPARDLPNFAGLVRLRSRFPGLRTEISIGGFSTGSDPFSAAAASAVGRSALVRSCIETFLRARPHVFDGIDLDWEFPVAGGAASTPVRAADRADALALLREFRRQLDVLGTATHAHYLLTAAMPAHRFDGYTPSRSWALAAAARVVDWFNLMTYSLTTASGSRLTGFGAPLRPAAGAPAGAASVQWAVGYYEAAGVPAAKIVLGAPFYGRVFEGVPPRSGGLFQRFRALGPALSYAQIAAGDPVGGQRHWNAVAAQPWIYVPATGAFLSYDDARAVAAKAHYAVAHGLRGVMMWEIGGDDSRHTLLDALSGPVLAARAAAERECYDCLPTQASSRRKR